MAKVAYPATSPYSLTPQTNTFLGNWVYRAIPPDNGDTILTLTSNYNYRPDLLSNDLYATPSYWWIFSIRNPILRKDPIWDFVTGLTIVIPTADYLKRIIGS